MNASTATASSSVATSTSSRFVAKLRSSSSRVVPVVSMPVTFSSWPTIMMTATPAR